MGDLRTWGLWSSALALSAACTKFDPDSAEKAVGDERLDVGGDIEVFSWWTSGGEQEAFDALLDEHARRVPDADVTNAAVEFADKAREQLAFRLASGNPPDLFQANMGADLHGWVITNGRNADASLVEGLSDLSDALDWGGAFDKDVLASVSLEGTLYGVPANVHRINALYYRKDLFAKFDLTVPTSIDELLEFCESISNDANIQASAPGGRMSCLGLGNKWDWTLSLLTFEMIFPAVAGADYYERYFEGKEEGLSDEVLETLDVAFRLYCGGKTSNCLEHTWFNPDVNERSWDEGVRKLSEGKALMAPMGDWAKGFLESEAGGGLTPGEDFDVVPFPGTSGTYVFTADTFLLPKAAHNRDGARSLLKTLGSVEGQIAFNKVKGSIPARVDIDPSHFDPLQQKAMKDFNESRKVRALSGLLPAGARNTIHPELSASFLAETTDVMARFLRYNYPLD